MHEKLSIGITLCSVIKRAVKPMLIGILLFSMSCSKDSRILKFGKNPVAIYQIDYDAHTRLLNIKAIDVTPSQAQKNQLGKAGLFQVGNVTLTGTTITGTLYITNNDIASWTGVEMQTYKIVSGNLNTVAWNTDIGSGWAVDNPLFGPWGWIFTSGTAGSIFTVPANGQSANKVIGFNATSSFVAWVYIYADVPVVSSIEPACALPDSIVVLSGYNFSTTPGTVTFGTTPATIVSWDTNTATVTVPNNISTSDVILKTVDSFYTNPVRFTLSGLQCGSPWPRFRQNILSTGLSFVNTNSTTGALKWKYSTGYAIFSSPAVGADGTIYVGTQGGSLYAINPNGTFKWSYPAGANYSSPAIGSDGTIYVGSYSDYNLYAINPDGTLKWRYPTGSYISSSPAIAPDGTIYIGSNDHYLYAVNPNGTLKWRYPTQLYIDSSPAIGADGTIYVGSHDHYLYAINPNGTLKWKYATYSDVASSPAIGSDGTIYVGSDDDNLYAINPDGTLKWKYAELNPVGSSPAVGSDGTIYVGSDATTSGNYLYAINPDGTLKWIYTAGNSIISSPAIGADGTIYVGSYDYNLYAIH